MSTGRNTRRSKSKLNATPTPKEEDDKYVPESPDIDTKQKFEAT